MSMHADSLTSLGGSFAVGQMPEDSSSLEAAVGCSVCLLQLSVCCSVCFGGSFVVLLSSSVSSRVRLCSLAVGRYGDE